MREMLTQSSFESFRVSTLDLMSLLEELLETIDEIEVSDLPINTLEPVLDEVIAVLRSDPIARQIVPDEVDLLYSYDKSTEIRKIDTAYLEESAIY